MSDVSYRLLAAADADLLCEGIRRVYGTTYPVPEFYDVTWIRAQIDAGLLHSIVGLDSSGAVIACMSTVLENPGEATADGSALMVASDYRGQGIVADLGTHSISTYQALGLGALHLYALALHDRVQSQSGRAGAVVTGCLPAWFARSARVEGYDYPEARIGAVPLLMPLGDLPARVSYLPAPYEDLLRRLYGELALRRELRNAPGDGSLPSSTQYFEEHRPANGQLRIVVTRCGQDMAMLLAYARSLCVQRDYEVCYFDLPLVDPGIGVAVKAARAAGLFFGALMVERRQGDNLRMQAYREDSAAPQYMVLHSSTGRDLHRKILDEQRTVAVSFL